MFSRLLHPIAEKIGIAHSSGAPAGDDPRLIAMLGDPIMHPDSDDTVFKRARHAQPVYPGDIQKAA